MVSYRQVLRKPVVSLADGAEVGEVRRVIVDSSQGRVVALAVEGPHWWLACPVVMLADVVGIAADTLTVKEKASLFDVGERPDFAEFLQDERPLIGRRVLLTTGAGAGQVRGFEFASPSGEIKALEIASSGDDVPRQRLLAEHITSFGRDVVVAQGEAMGEAPDAVADKVAAEVAAPLDKGPRPAAAKPPAPAAVPDQAQPEGTGFVPLAKSDLATEAKLKLAKPARAPAPAPAPLEAKAPVQTSALAQTPVSAEATVPAEAIAPAQPSAPAERPAQQNGGVTTGADLAQLFRERQERFLLGKTAQRQVRDDEGQVIVAAGDEIAQETLEKVKQAGKLLDLTASVSLKR